MRYSLVVFSASGSPCHECACNVDLSCVAEACSTSANDLAYSSPSTESNNLNQEYTPFTLSLSYVDKEWLPGGGFGMALCHMLRRSVAIAQRAHHQLNPSYNHSLNQEFTPFNMS
jgi:hypothetical protein